MSTPPTLRDLLLQGESEVLEFKERIRDPVTLARLIASFANANGGRILVGVKEPLEIVGVETAELERTLGSALERLEPSPSAKVSFIETEAGAVADISVERSPSVVLVQGSAFVRVGSMTRPMEWSQVRSRLHVQPTDANIEALLKQSQRQTEMLERLLEDNERLKDSNEALRAEVGALSDPRARRRERVIGGVIGVAASLTAAFLWLLGTKQLPWLRT